MKGRDNMGSLLDGHARPSHNTWFARSSVQIKIHLTLGRYASCHVVPSFALHAKGCALEAVLSLFKLEETQLKYHMVY